MILLERRQSAHGTVYVHQLPGDRSVVYLQGDGIQSHADEQGETLLGYAQMMCSAVIATAGQSALVIGCAGGTIATTLHRRGVEVVTVDINPDAFELAERYFHLPACIERHVVDGRAYLGQTERKWDAIVIDAHDGITPPAHLTSVEFYALVAQRLTPSGIVVSNIVTDSLADIQADRIASAMAEAGLDVRLFDDSNKTGGNCIVIGGSAFFDRSRLKDESPKFRRVFKRFKRRQTLPCAPLYETRDLVELWMAD